MVFWVSEHEGCQHVDEVETGGVKVSKGISDVTSPARQVGLKEKDYGRWVRGWGLAWVAYRWF